MKVYTVKNRKTNIVSEISEDSLEDFIRHGWIRKSEKGDLMPNKFEVVESREVANTVMIGVPKEIENMRERVIKADETLCEEVKSKETLKSKK